MCIEYGGESTKQTINKVVEILQEYGESAVAEVVRNPWLVIV
jgi:pantoate kinase